MNDTVYIEYCVNCKSHAWCTNHDEAKYQQYFEGCKVLILQRFPEFRVTPNQVPATVKKKISGKRRGLRLTSTGTVPRLGAFEVYFRGHLMFSKLKTGLWPSLSAIVQKIHCVVEDPDFLGRLRKFSLSPLARVQSARVVKRAGKGRTTKTSVGRKQSAENITVKRETSETVDRRHERELIEGEMNEANNADQVVFLKLRVTPPLEEDDTEPELSLQGRMEAREDPQPRFTVSDTIEELSEENNETVDNSEFYENARTVTKSHQLTLPLAQTVHKVLFT